MALFEDAYLPHRLGNWQIPKNSTATSRWCPNHTTRPLSDDHGRGLCHHSKNRKDVPNNSRTCHRNDTETEQRFQSAQLPTKSSHLCITGSALASGKASRFNKMNLGQQTVQQSSEIGSNLKVQNFVAEEKEEDQFNPPGTDQDDPMHHSDPVYPIVKPTIPDTPRRAAILLAARQKKHRPLPDVTFDCRHLYIPENYSSQYAPALAFTADTPKTKGPTSCTKRHIVRLVKDSNSAMYPSNKYQPSVMDLAIKWEVKTPPSSATPHFQTRMTKPVEKTLEWLYDRPATNQSIEIPETCEPDVTNVTSPEKCPAFKITKQESAKSRDSGVSVRSRTSCDSLAHSKLLLDMPESNNTHLESDTESGYNSPRSLEDKSKICNNEPFKIKRRSPTPPKNHFVVSSAFNGKLNRSDLTVLPEYPLQRRSPRPSKSSSPQPVSPMVKRSGLVSEYPPQKTPSPLFSHDNRVTEDETDMPNDNSSNQFHIDNEQQIDHERSSPPNHAECHTQARAKNRTRPCLACQWAATTPAACHKNPKASESTKPCQTAAFKAGLPFPNKTVPSNDVMERRLAYKAPKPFPICSHARHVKGTLAPPLAVSQRAEPVVYYPDFKRLNSTYRLSYGINSKKKHKVKNLTTMLNEKNSTIWKF